MKSDYKFSTFVYNFWIRKKFTRFLSDALYPMYRFLAFLLDTSRDFYIMNLREKHPKFYSVRKSIFLSYEDVQIEGNIRKLNRIQKGKKFVDKERLPNASVRFALQRILSQDLSQPFFGLCHGVRSGLENNYMKRMLSGEGQVLGTDISPTASDIENCIQWDFHESKAEWINSTDFIYSNSIDQSNRPIEALLTWINCLRPETGILYLDLGRHSGKKGNTLLDPFSIEPELFGFFFYHHIQGAVIRNILFPDKEDWRSVIYEISRESVAAKKRAL
jgi:hypothetical protein